MSSSPSSSVRARPATCSMTKNGWPRTPGSGSSHRMAGTGYPRARRIRMMAASRRPSVANMPSCSIRTTPCPPVQRTSSMSRLNPPEMTVTSSNRAAGPVRSANHCASRPTSSGSAGGGPPSGSRWWPVNSSSSGAASLTSSSNHCRHSACTSRASAADLALPVTSSLSTSPAASSTARSSAPGRLSSSRSTAARFGLGSGRRAAPYAVTSRQRCCSTAPSGSRAARSRASRSVVSSTNTVIAAPPPSPQPQSRIRHPRPGRTSRPAHRSAARTGTTRTSAGAPRRSRARRAG